jgi:2-dehydropantoate 2-reductase
LKHVILGAGAVGGLVGAALAQEGEQPTLLVRPETRAQYPNSIFLDRPSGHTEVAVHVDTKFTGNVDVLWIAVKANQLATAIDTIQTNNLGIATIIPLLNGIEHVALLRARFDHASVMPATIAVEVERTSPGHIIQRSPFVRLALSAIGEHKLEGLDAKLKNAGFSCEFRSDEKTMLWSKLAFLAPFALTSTAADKTIGEIRADDTWRARLEFAAAEACDVARADGATVGPEQILTTLQSLPATMRSSMQKDVAAGRTPELDAIGGAIIRAGWRYGIGAPTIHSLIANIEERLTKQARRER